MPRILAALAAVLLLASCAPGPVVTAAPATTAPSASAAPTASPSEVPFAAASWPVSGSACGTAGYTGLIGRIEARDARTIRFTLCEPDRAFLARIAHPALGVLDTATLDRLAADAGSARSLAGTGPYRIDRWDPGRAIILVRAASEATPVSRTPTVVLRWAADAGQRAYELQSATVDGIDAPGPLELDRIETQPELVVVPRAGLSTAYLAFGSDAAFNDVRVRRAIAGALDRQALARAAFPSGSVVPTHLVPCVVAGACAGRAWYGFDGPAAAASLAATRFDLQSVHALHVPNRAVPGLPDPLAAAQAIQAQLKATLGLQTTIDTLGVSDFNAALAAGTLDGLFLAGQSSDVADPAAFITPLFGPGVAGAPAAQVPRVRAALAEAVATSDPAAREAAFGRANDAILTAVPVIPLVNAGSVAVFRSDVANTSASPLGIDPLGAFTPGDRRQLVFMQSTEPTGAYCGDQASADALRLCALVTEGLYGFAPGTLTVEPRLAERCAQNDDATEWTCTLRRGVMFHDGARLDAADVLASYVAQWDPGSPLRLGAGRPESDFAAFRALFGALLPGAPAGG